MLKHVRIFFELRRLKNKMKPRDYFEQLVIKCRAVKSGEFIYNADIDHTIFAIKNLFDQAVENRNSVFIYGHFSKEVKKALSFLINKSRLEIIDVNVLWDDKVDLGFILVKDAYYMYYPSEGKAVISFNNSAISEVCCQILKRN